MTFWYIAEVFLIISFIWKALFRFSGMASSPLNFQSVHSLNNSLNISAISCQEREFDRCQEKCKPFNNGQHHGHHKPCVVSSGWLDFTKGSSRGMLLWPRHSPSFCVMISFNDQREKKVKMYFCGEFKQGYWMQCQRWCQRWWSLINDLCFSKNRHRFCFWKGLQVGCVGRECY